MTERPYHTDSYLREARIDVVDDGGPSIMLGSQLRAQARLADALREHLLALQARDRLAAGSGAPKAVVDLPVGRPIAELTALATQITAIELALAVFGTPDGKVLVARSSDVDIDARAVPADLLRPAGGRG